MSPRMKAEARASVFLTRSTSSCSELVDMGSALAESGIASAAFSARRLQRFNLNISVSFRSRWADD
jgi:hypothetical protein